MNKNTITTLNGNHYFYSDKERSFLYLPNIVHDALVNLNDIALDAYHANKLEFLKSHGILGNDPTHFQTEYTKEQVVRNLANLTQLLIEVTDGCNLKCKYCGYGDMYENHGVRHGKKQDLAGILNLIDYICHLKKTENNLMANGSYSIGFYGGEPLLNFPFIKEVVNYARSVSNEDMTFSFNMTTNAMFLDRYMDFLAENDFNLLISLDGNEFGDSYRVDRSGSPSFRIVMNNVKKLKETHPDYFERKVNFNSVLHDRNSVLDTTLFIYKEFGKITRIAELNTSGVSRQQRDAFAKMFKHKSDSLAEAQANNSFGKITEHDGVEGAEIHSFLMKHTGNHFMKYSDMFIDPSTVKYIPTSTCKPFEKKLYVTVEGKIFACEKIGQTYPLGFLNKGRVEIDTLKVAHFYTKRYQSIVSFCRECAASKYCNQCFYFLDLSKEKLVCPARWSIRQRNHSFSKAMSFIEDNPGSYHHLLSKIKIS